MYNVKFHEDLQINYIKIENNWRLDFTMINNNFFVIFNEDAKPYY